MVVGEIPVVPLLLPQLLGGQDTVLQDRKAFLPQEISGNVSAPGHRVAGIQRFVQHRHQLFDGNVVTGSQPPFVGSFDDKPLIERMVRKAGQADIVVRIESQTFGEGAGRIGLSLTDESLRAFPYVLINDALHIALPAGSRRLVPERRLLFRGEPVQLRLAFAPYDAAYQTLQFREKNFEVGQRIACHRARGGHGVLRTDSVPADHFDHVVAGAALRNLAVAVHPDVVLGTVHVILADDEHFAQVIGPACFPQDLALQKSQRGVIPAGAAAILILHACDRNLLDRGKSPGALCRYPRGNQHGRGKSS